MRSVRLRVCTEKNVDSGLFELFACQKFVPALCEGSNNVRTDSSKNGLEEDQESVHGDLLIAARRLASPWPRFETSLGATKARNHRYPNFLL
jgi:hypothetical protein